MSSTDVFNELIKKLDAREKIKLRRFERFCKFVYKLIYKTQKPLNKEYILPNFKNKIRIQASFFKVTVKTTCEFFKLKLLKVRFEIISSGNKNFFPFI